MKLPADFSKNIKLALKTVSEDAASEEDDPPRYYRIIRGDNISTIAREFSVPIQEVLDINGLHRRSKIYAGQILVLPQRGEKIITAKKSKIETKIKKQNTKLAEAKKKRLRQEKKGLDEE